MEPVHEPGVFARPANHAFYILSYCRDRYKRIPVGFSAAKGATYCAISIPMFHGMRNDEQRPVIDLELRAED
jgi:hypothetical protein